VDAGARKQLLPDVAGQILEGRFGQRRKRTRPRQGDIETFANTARA